jgi:hypothetical protein
VSDHGTPPAPNGDAGEPPQPDYPGPPPTAPYSPEATPQYGAQPYGQPSYPAPPYPDQPYAGQPYAGQPYAGQPYAGQPPPPYTAAPYGVPGQYPNPYPPPYPAGYPPAPYGYPAGAPYHPYARPGQVLAASVLGYVLAGLLIVTGFMLLFGASLSSDLGDAFDSDTSGVTTELAFDGLVNLIIGGLLIAGGVLFTGANPRGRRLLAIGAIATLVDCIYWLARADGDGDAAIIVILFGAPAAISLVLAFSTVVRNWLSAYARRY